MKSFTINCTSNGKETNLKIKANNEAQALDIVKRLIKEGKLMVDNNDIKVIQNAQN